jgi:pyochelin synthetase
MERDLLVELHRRGIRLRLAGDRLDVVAPSGALTPDLRRTLSSRRDELIALLQRGQAAGEPLEVAADPAARHEPFPLTDVQHAYWVGRSPAVELGGVATHFYFERERRGLDMARAERALDRVIARHDMLRAVVDEDGRQRVLPEVPPYRIACRDLRGATPAAQLAEFERVRGEMADRVLPCERWPLFEVRATLLPDDRVRLHFSLDLLIVDAWSMYLLFQDWRRWYEDPSWAPEPLELTFRDYVLAERTRRDGPAHRRARQHWSERLAELPAAPELPLARLPAQAGRPRFTRRCAGLHPDAWRSLVERARRHGVTPSVALMAAFAEVLRRWSRHPGFTLNLTLFNRRPVHRQVEEIVGDFTSMVLLAVEDPGDEPFHARAGRLQRRLLEGLEHLDHSGVQVLRDRARLLGGGPAAAMPVVFTSALGLGAREEGDQAMRFFGDAVYGISQTPQVWLDHQVFEEAGGLVCNWDAVDDLFPAGVLDEMFAANWDLLGRLAADDGEWERRGALVPLPGAQAEERRLANATHEPWPEETLAAIVAERAAAAPDAPAVLWRDGALSYRELVACANRLAHRLVAAGAARGRLVGVVLPRGWGQAAAVLSVAVSGAAYLPVDPAWPEARRLDLLETGCAGVVITDARLRDELAWPPGTTVLALDDPETLRSPSTPPPGGPAPADLAYVIFTSGSTGRPKGVMIEHRAACNTIRDINRRFGVGPGDRVLALSSLSFDLSVWDVFGVLAAGGAVVLPDPDGVHDPAHWTELVERHGVTIWNSVPALLQAWADAQPDAGGASLRLAMLSGDWIPVGLPDRVRAGRPDLRVVSLGGATEASIWSVVYPIGEVPAEWTRIPYGRPLANQTLHVLDDRLEHCPAWVTGEIHIGGAGVAAGYWADPARTDERFIVHPGTGERLYRTGDLGRYLPGGDIELLGREDAQVKINGHRIELGEVAAALRRQPGVGDALVTVATEPHSGRRHLVAHVVPGGEGAEAAELVGEARWAELLAAGEAAVRRGASDLADDLAGFGRVWRGLEKLCAPVVARALGELGVLSEAGAACSAAGMVRDHGLDPAHEGLLRQWLGLLADWGALEPDERPGEYRCVVPVDAAALGARVERGLAALDAPASCRPLVDYFAACSASQLALLRGEVSPLELLLPDGRWDVTDFLYAGNPVSAIQNRAAAAVAGALPAGRPLRVLEAGAGTGATTAGVLDALPAGAEYRFTDVSSFFTERARRRFGRAGMAFGTLDVDRPLAAQGVAAGSVDLVVAANVLHDARDLDATLAELRSALAPGGVLVLIEGTANSALQLVTVGFLEGFGHALDRRELALLTAGEWLSRLRDAGFAAAASVPAGGAVSEAMAQHVIVARAPAGGPALDAGALRAGLERLLPEYMVPRHYAVLEAFPLSANGKVDPSALPSPWAEAPAADRVPPSTETERLLFAIWAEALGHDGFGVDDDFFALGGDSVHAVGILGHLRARAGLEMTAEQGFQWLFEHPTVAQMASSLDSR